jgi:hypothetical protein
VATGALIGAAYCFVCYKMMLNADDKKFVKSITMGAVQAEGKDDV